MAEKQAEALARVEFKNRERSKTLRELERQALLDKKHVRATPPPLAVLNTPRRSPALPTVSRSSNEGFIRERTHVCGTAPLRLALKSVSPTREHSAVLVIS